MPNSPLPNGTLFCVFESSAHTPVHVPGTTVPLSYSLKAAGRSSPKLTWSFSGTVLGVKTPTDEITIALSRWAAAAPTLVFTKVTSGANITIGVGNAGTAPGGTVLAVTSSDGTSITISNAVTFVASGASTDFLNVITHELGHALGLLHATTPASIMYPFASTTEALQPDDIHAIQALYNWSAPKTLQGGSSHTPSICLCNDTLVMAWRGAGDDRGIWISTSTTDGQSWSTQRRIPDASSIASPGLCWDGTNAWLVFRGATDDNLYWAASTDFFQKHINGIHELRDRGSSNGPRIAIANGVPTMVWKGVNNDTALFYSTYINGQWGPQKPLGFHSESSPAICADVLGGARIVWRGAGNDQTLWTCSLSAAGNATQIPVSWTIPGNGSAPGTTGSPASHEGPSITTAKGGRLVMIWRGVQGDDNLYFTQFANDVLPAGKTALEWSTQEHIVNTHAEMGASIADFNGVLHAVYKGGEGDTAIRTITL